MTDAGPPPPPPSWGSSAGVPPPPPPPLPPAQWPSQTTPAASVERHLKPDGSVKGPRLWVALTMIGVGLVVGVVSLVVLVTAFVDSLSGPRFAIPGSATVDLDAGTWVVYERTGTSSSAGGVEVTTGGSVTIGPGDVSVAGPAPVEVSGRSFGTETVTVNSRVYTGAARLEVDEAGDYTVTIDGPGEPSQGGEVLIARPLTDVLGKWPFIVLLLAGGGLVILGIVLWIIGGVHRGAVKRAARTV